MRSNKLWRVIWVVGIYAILGIVLYLVILYKVEWENKDLNTYLYFYDCGHQVCTSTSREVNYYSKIVCPDDICPYIDRIIDDNIILKRDNKKWIYNYIDGNIINDKYNDYRYIKDNMYVVSNDNENYGIIDDSGKVLVDLKYNYIDDYNSEFISYIKDNMYGIANASGEVIVKPTYEDIVLINDKLFAGKIDNVYQMISYSDMDASNSNKYDYVYAYNDIILVINNKKIDILDSNLKSTLVMKIDTFYDYKIEGEGEFRNILRWCEYLF